MFTGDRAGHAGVLLLAAAVLQYQMPWMDRDRAAVRDHDRRASRSRRSRRPKRARAVRDVIDATKRGARERGYEVPPGAAHGRRLGRSAARGPLALRARARPRAAPSPSTSRPRRRIEPLDWSAASSLTLKVSALTNIESRETGGEMIETITPVLVALTPVDSSLRDFAQDHRGDALRPGPRRRRDDRSGPRPASSRATRPRRGAERARTDSRVHRRTRPDRGRGQPGAANGESSGAMAPA